MTMSVEAAAQALREATRETVRRYSTWYLIQGVLMVLAGIVALVYPFVSTVALVVVLGWLLILSGIVQGISLIGAQNVPNFWLQFNIGCPVNNCRRALPSPPWGSGCYPDAPFDCLLYGGGFREITFFAHDTAASELGLGLSKRHYWNTAVYLSFD